MNLPNLDKSQVKHFLALVAIGVVCAYFLNFRYFSVGIDFGLPHRGMNLLQALMAAYLYILVTPGYLVTAWAAFILGVHLYSLEGTLFDELLMWGVNILFVWFIAGYFAKVKTPNRLLKWIYRAVPYLVGLSALDFVVSVSLPPI